MDSTSVYGLDLLVLEGTGGKALATDHRVRASVMYAGKVAGLRFIA